MFLRTTAGGLVLAEQGQDQAAVSRALKQIDDRLVLQRNSGYWQVLAVTGWDRPDQVHTIVTWADQQGRPLPLSSGLVGEVQKHRLEAKGRWENADQRNLRLEQQMEKDRAAVTEAVIADHRARVERGRVSVSMGPDSSKRYWQRTSPPRSGGV